MWVVTFTFYTSSLSLVLNYQQLLLMRIKDEAMEGPWHLKVHIHWRKLYFYSVCLATFDSWRCFCWCYKSYQASVVHNSIVGWRWEMWDSNESMTAMVWYDDINTTVTRHRHWHMKYRCPPCPLSTTVLSAAPPLVRLKLS